MSRRQVQQFDYGSECCRLRRRHWRVPWVVRGNAGDWGVACYFKQNKHVLFSLFRQTKQPTGNLNSPASPKLNLVFAWKTNITERPVVADAKITVANTDGGKESLSLIDIMMTACSIFFWRWGVLFFLV